MPLRAAVELLEEINEEFRTDSYQQNQELINKTRAFMSSSKLTDFCHFNHITLQS